MKSKDPTFVIGNDIGHQYFGINEIDTLNRCVSSKTIIMGNNLDAQKERRLARSVRNGYKRKKLRKRAIFSELTNVGILPDCKNMSKSDLNNFIRTITSNVSNKELRIAALDAPVSLLDLAGIILILSERRGFDGGIPIDDVDDEDLSKFKKQIVNMDSEIENTNSRTAYECIKKLSVGHESIDSYHPNAKTTSIDKVYGLRYSRKHYFDEFDAIMEVQKQYHPQLTETNIKFLRKMLYYRRPLKLKYPSECIYESTQKNELNKIVYHGKFSAPKALPISQKFRLITDIQNYFNVEGSHLNEMEQKFVYERLDRGDAIPSLKKEFKKCFSINLTSKIPENKKIKNTTRKSLISILTKFYDDELLANAEYSRLDSLGAWDDIVKNAIDFDRAMLPKNAFDYGGLSYRELCVVDESRRKSCMSGFVTRIVNTYNIPNELATILANFNDFPDSGYESLSEKAMRKLLVLMETGIHKETAINRVYGSSRIDNRPLHKITNNNVVASVASMVLKTIKKSVHGAMKRGHKFSDIRICIESSKSFILSDKQKKKIDKDNKDRAKEREKIIETISKETGAVATRKTIMGYELWVEQDGVCPLCGNPVHYTDVAQGNADLDHIVPRDISHDSSMRNMMLTCRRCNSVKGKRTPFEAFSSDEANWKAITSRIKSIYKGKPKKKDRILSKTISDYYGFSERDLHTTHNIINIMVSKLLALGFRRSQILLPQSHYVKYILSELGVRNNATTEKKDRSDLRNHGEDAFGCAHFAFVKGDNVKRIPFAGYIDEVKNAFDPTNYTFASRVRHKSYGAAHAATALKSFKPIDGKYEYSYLCVEPDPKAKTKDKIDKYGRPVLVYENGRRKYVTKKTVNHISPKTHHSKHLHYLPDGMAERVDVYENNGKYVGVVVDRFGYEYKTTSKSLLLKSSSAFVGSLYRNDMFFIDGVAELITSISYQDGRKCSVASINTLTGETKQRSSAEDHYLMINTKLKPA